MSDNNKLHEFLSREEKQGHQLQNKLIQSQIMLTVESERPIDVKNISVSQGLSEEEYNNTYSQDEDDLYCDCYMGMDNYDNELEITFLVRDKFKRVFTRIEEVMPKLMLELRLRGDILYKLLTANINIDTALINVNGLRKDLDSIYPIQKQVELDKICHKIREIISFEYFETIYCNEDNKSLCMDKNKATLWKSFIPDSGYELAITKIVVRESNVVYARCEIKVSAFIHNNKAQIESILSNLIGTFGRKEQLANVHFKAVWLEYNDENSGYYKDYKTCVVTNIFKEKAIWDEKKQQDRFIRDEDVWGVQIIDLKSKSTVKDSVELQHIPTELVLWASDLTKRYKFETVVILSKDIEKIILDTSILTEMMKEEGFISEKERFKELLRKLIFNTNITKYFLDTKAEIQSHFLDAEVYEIEHFVQRVEARLGTENDVVKALKNMLLYYTEKDDSSSYEDDSLIDNLADSIEQLEYHKIENIGYEEHNLVWKFKALLTNIEILKLRELFRIIERRGNKVLTYSLSEIK